MTMYEAWHSGNKIKEIIVIRANGTSYWTDKGMKRRINDFYSVWYTFDEAREYLKARLEREISNAQSDIDRAKNAIKELNHLTP